MKLLALSIYLLATVMVTRGKISTMADFALHGAFLSSAEIQECYQNTNLTTSELITSDEIKNGTYDPTSERTTKNGCFSACILQKRGLIIDTEIQREKFYAREAHDKLPSEIRDKIYKTIDRCFTKVETSPNLCDKSFSLLSCLFVTDVRSH